MNAPPKISVFKMNALPQINAPLRINLSDVEDAVDDLNIVDASDDENDIDIEI